MRAVCDTNVLVSYLLTHRPPIATLIDRYLAEEAFTLVTSPALLAELERVLSYPRLAVLIDAHTRRRFVALIAALSELVDPPEEVPTISRDPDDDQVIACAVVGSADVIVSGDRDLLSLGRVGEIPILTPAAFLVLLDPA
jgi:uncharacterized protein